MIKIKEKTLRFFLLIGGFFSGFLFGVAACIRKGASIL